MLSVFVFVFFVLLFYNLPFLNRNVKISDCSGVRLKVDCVMCVTLCACLCVCVYVCEGCV